jgi:hypothetical protein
MVNADDKVPFAMEKHTDEKQELRESFEQERPTCRNS